MMLERLIQAYENLRLETIDHLIELYAKDALFKDPFNEVQGQEAIRAIFTHMFSQVNEPRFKVTHHLHDAKSAYLSWNFHLRFKRWSSAEQIIRGCTYIEFNSEGLIKNHRDYWDAAEELYEKLPAIGSFMRFLKQQARN